MTAKGMPHNIKIQRTVFKIPASWLCLMPATDLGVGWSLTTKLEATFIYRYGELHGYHFWGCRAKGRRSEQHP